MIGPFFYVQLLFLRRNSYNLLPCINLPHRCHTGGISSGLQWGEATVYGD